jgi:hypothetical protein
MTTNQITVYLDPAQFPLRTDDQPVFDSKWAAVLAAFPTFGAQFNAGVANFNAAAAGSAYAIPYTIDLSGTSDIDPGPGKLRFDSATQNAATTLRLDLTGAGGTTDYSAMIDTFDASTSTVKGAIRIVKQGDASKFLLFNVTGRTAPTGYRDIGVTPVASSSANPFVNGDAVLLFFQRTGDKGDTGAPAVSGNMFLLGTATVSTAVANIDFLSVFSSTYDNYLIEVQGLMPSASSALNIRLAKSGAVDTGSSYYAGPTSGSLTNQTSFSLGTSVGTAIGGGIACTVELRNMSDASHIKSMTATGCFLDGTTYQPLDFSCAYTPSPASAASGFRLFFGTGNITAGTVRVYGIKNT